MTFNGADKSNSICSHIDFILFGDGSTFNTEYSLIDRTRNVNIIWDEAVAELYKADPNFEWDDTSNPDYPIAIVDLAAGVDNYGLLDSALVIHRVRIKGQNGEYITLTPVLRRELDDTDLKSTGTPEKYYKIGGAVFPIPIPDYGATDGVELEFQRGANHFTIDDDDKEPGFNPQFHQFLPVGAALMYAIAQGMTKKINILLSEKERIRNAMREHYERRSPDEQPQIRLKRRSVRHYGL